MAEPKLRVLTPLDGSPEAESILPALLPLFRSDMVRLTLFGVAPHQGTGASLKEYFGRLRKSLLLDGVSSQSKIEWGNPAEEILWMGKSRNVDLIAMTTHGRTGLRRAVLGSVTEKVLRHAQVPVVACRPDTRVGNWNRILVALDGSAFSESILPLAARLARATGAGLHLVRVRSVLPAIATHHAIPMQLPGADPRPYLEGVVSALGAQGVLALPETRDGEESTQIGACARDIGAGLICLATHGRRGLSRQLLGSVAESVLRTAPCPVLVSRITAQSARRTASVAASGSERPAAKR